MEKNRSKSSFPDKMNMQHCEKAYTESQLLINSGRHNEAIIELEKLLESYPDFSLAHNDLGVLHFNNGNEEKALKHYQQAANLEPQNITFRKNLADFYYIAQNRVEEALRIYLEILSSNPYDIETMLAMGSICVSIKKYDDAETFFNRVLDIEPDNKNAWQFLVKLSGTPRGITTSDSDTSHSIQENANSPGSFFGQEKQGVRPVEAKSTKQIRIKVISPSDFDKDESRRLLWGDYWVKFELERAFESLGLEVVDDTPDVVLYLFGVPVLGLSNNTYNIVWLYSHPDMVTPDNLKQFDKIFCLSSSFIPKLTAMGYKDIDLMIGATCKTPLNIPNKYDISFIGNSRGPQGRQIITDIGDIPYNFKVWGEGWNAILPKQYYGGRYYDYQKLGEVYASSVISINDHHPDMSRDGFVAVKIFDILASGGFAISDKNTGIAEIFGDAVPQYKSPEHLRELLDLYITRPDARLKLMEKGRRIALSHTFREHAEQFVKDLKPAIEAKRRTRTPLPVSSKRESANRGTDERIKVLYIDTISTPTAACNVNGMVKAYSKVSNLKPFDYRGLAAKHGQGRMNQMLIEEALRFQPDMIHMGKSELISGSTIKAIKKQIDTYVIHFYGDFRWDPQPWVIDIGKYADCTLFNNTDGIILDKYRAAGVKNIGGFWDAGTDPEVFYLRDVEKTKDVVFMGGNNIDVPYDGNEKRRRLIEEAANQGINVHVYGSNWQYLLELGYGALHIHPFVTENEFSEVCSSTKITLGINAVNDIQMYASWRRIVNCMASGAFHLTHYVPGMETLFQNKKHLVWFNSVSEATELIKYYLSHNEEREVIAEAGRKEVLAKHTWDARIAELIMRMEKHKVRKRVFIVGAHQSGKSTLVKLLRLNGINAIDENPGTYKSILALGKLYYYGLCHDVTNELKLEVPDNGMISANVAYFPFITKLSEIYKHSKFIFLHKNGIDQMSQWLSAKVFTPRDIYGPFRLNPPKECQSRFEKLCWYWNEINQIMLRDLNDVDHISISYSDLISGKKIHDIASYLRVTIENIPDFSEHLKPKEYPDWTESQMNTFTDMCGDAMGRLNYDLGKTGEKKVSPIYSLSPYAKRSIKGSLNADAYMVAFHKAGRTWMKVLLAKLVELLGFDTKRVEFLQHSHSAYDPALNIARTSENLSIDKSGLRITLLFRDPRDIVVSYYFELTKRIGKFKGTMSEFIRDNTYGISSIVNYYNNWYENRFNVKQFTILRYEDLRKDAEKELNNLLSFLNMENQVSAEMLKSAIKYSSFANMRKMESSGKTILNDNSLDLNKRGDRSDTESFKTRKGKVGGYVEYFNDEDIKYVDEQLKNLHRDLMSVGFAKSNVKSQEYLIPDTYLISHPKTGSTLIRHVFARLTSHLNVDHKNKELLPCRHADYDTEVMNICPKSEKMPRDKKPFKIILLIRDPRETIVSYYVERVKKGHPAFGKTISEFIRDKQYGIEPVLLFYKKWYDNRDSVQKFRVYNYHDLLDNPKMILCNILSFLGYSDGVSDKVLENVVNSEFVEKWRRKEMPWENSSTFSALMNKSNANNSGQGEKSSYSDYLSVDDLSFISTAVNQKAYSDFMELYMDYFDEDDIEYVSNALNPLDRFFGYQQNNNREYHNVENRMGRVPDNKN